MTATRTADEVLVATSNEGLLTAFAHETHAMHAAKAAGYHEIADEARTKRDLVKAEILRRMKR